MLPKTEIIGKVIIDSDDLENFIKPLLNKKYIIEVENLNGLDYFIIIKRNLEGELK